MLLLLTLAWPACHRESGHDVIIQAVDALPEKLIPGLYTNYNELQVAFQIYETLLRLSDDRQTLLPHLASTWQYSADFKQLTLQLRDGIRFHDGTRLDAKAAKHSIDWLKGHNPASPYLAAIDSVLLVDARVIRIHLNRPDARFLYFLASGTGPVMMSKTALDSLGEHIFKHPVGTGPFKVISWDTDRIRLQAFDLYRERKGNVPELHFVYYPYSGQLEKSMEEGKTDVVYAVHGSTIDRLQWSGKIDYIVNSSIMCNMLAFNLENELTGDPEIRKNLLSHMNTRKFVINMNRGTADLATNPLPPAFKGFSDLKQKPDDTEADSSSRPQMEQPGKTLTLYYPESAFLRPTLLLGIKADIMKSGFDMELHPVKPSDDYFEITGRKSTPMFAYGWRSDILGDPGNFLWSLFHSESPYNFFHYRRSEVDTLLEKAIREFDTRKRHDHYRQIVKLVLEDTPAIFLDHLKEYYAYNVSKIKSISMTPYGIINYKDVVIHEANAF